jgi:hypothetical protein
LQRGTLRAKAVLIGKRLGAPDSIPLTSSAQDGERYWSKASDIELLAELVSRDDPEKGISHGFFTLTNQLQVLPGDRVEIDFQRTENGAPRETTERHHSVVIDPARYYLELGLLIPLVYHGSRKVALNPVAAGDAMRVDVVRDWHVTVAPALHYFPWGRAKGPTTSFRSCRSRGCWENWLGLALGTGVDAPLVSLYAGLLLEPVSGLAFSGGIAVLKGEYLPRGRAEGMLLPPGAFITPQEGYMWRPFGGVAFTLDLFHSIQQSMTNGTRSP